MSDLNDLQRLARYYSLQTTYYDVDDRLCLARPETLERALQLLGAPIDSPQDAPDALRSCRQSLWQQTIEPVHVAWDGRLSFRIRIPSQKSGQSYSIRIICEDGGEYTQSGQLDDLSLEGRRTVEGVTYNLHRAKIPQQLPIGYHRLQFALSCIDKGGSETWDTLVISSPLKAFTRETGESRRRWGVFVPLYALHTESSWGGGDFSDLEAMMSWVSSQGGSLVATLPLLSWLAEVSDDPSPYSPASRLFWNEFYLDVTRIPELSDCSAAQSALSAETTQQALNELRENPHVDYRRQMQLKRDVLMRLSEHFFNQEAGGQKELQEYRQKNRELEQFARFRAVGEKQGSVWQLWPDRQRNGDIQTADYDQNIFEYHLYTQWQVERQLQSLAQQAQATDMLWYLDFPLGVAGAGYDVWRERDVFGIGASGGAPPDAFFTKGQNWGFPPLHPHRLRQQEYRYLIQSLRRHFTYARLLRIDHAMCLHRLYWIPDGFDAKHGVYVRYQTEEMFAILVLESHRYKAEIVGENLGTVPAAVDNGLTEHRIRDMYVVQYEAKPNRTPPLRNVQEMSVASLNTHDMPPFASFWTAFDVDDRLDLELFDEAGAAEERERRANLRLALTNFLCERGLLEEESLDPQDVLEAFLAWLASSPANVVLVNLEDLWAETLPQNTPGTFMERCNWRKKLRYRFEEFRELPQVTRALESVNDKRNASMKEVRGQRPEVSPSG